MRLTANVLCELGMEDIVDKTNVTASQPGYKEQPEVALYLPEEDGVNQIYQQMKTSGVPVVMHTWAIQPGLEASQGLLTQLIKQQKDQEEAEEEKEATHSDYSLYALVPSTKPFLYEQLNGEKAKVILVDDAYKYPEEMMDHLVEKVGLENMFLDVDSAIAFFKR